MRSLRFATTTFACGSTSGQMAAAIAVSALLLFAFALPCLAQPTDPQPAERRALVVRYSDGRETVNPIASRTILFWTPMFPRLPGASTERDGLPLSALDINGTVTGDDLVVRLSLLYGSPHQKQVPVATVRVSAATPVRVEELRSFGVAPIALSLIALAPAATNLPAVTCVSGALDVRVEPVGPELRAYRITVVNNSARTLVAFEVQAYTGARASLSGRQKKPRQENLLPPGGRHQFELRAGALAAGSPEGQAAWRPFDRIAITSVMWDDGIVEGDPAPAVGEQVYAAGNAIGLRRVIALFGQARSGDAAAADLSRHIDVVPLDVDDDEVARLVAGVADPRLLDASRARQLLQLGIQAVKDAARQDIAGCAKRTGGSGDLGACVAAIVADYQLWLGRATQRARGTALSSHQESAERF